MYIPPLVQAECSRTVPLYSLKQVQLLDIVSELVLQLVSRVHLN